MGMFVWWCVICVVGGWWIGSFVMVMGCVMLFYWCGWCLIVVICWLKVYWLVLGLCR